MEVNTYGAEVTREMMEGDFHRDFVGGMWEKLGKLQIDFLIDQGLRPEMKFLDIGCGCLRAGIHLVRYLEQGNYYGLDINESLLHAGYDVELPRLGLQDRLPRSNLLHEKHFCASGLGVKFDMMIAQSLFSHLPMNHIRKCLIEMAKSIRDGGVMYATFFEAPAGHAIENELVHRPGSVTTYADHDPYHYHLDDFYWIIKGLPWTMNYHGEWNHPRGQRMLSFVRHDSGI